MLWASFLKVEKFAWASSACSLSIWEKKSKSCSEVLICHQIIILILETIQEIIPLEDQYIHCLVH